MLDRRSHPSAHPLPPLRLAQTPVYVDRGYCPGGRWERILRTIHDQPLTETEILRAVHDGRYPRRIERRKIHAALIAMTPSGADGAPAGQPGALHGHRARRAHPAWRGRVTLHLDPIPDRHPRLIVWCGWFRRAGWSVRDIAKLFNISIGELIEAGVEP